MLPNMAPLPTSLPILPVSVMPVSAMLPMPVTVMEVIILVMQVTILAMQVTPMDTPTKLLHPSLPRNKTP
jgi:hypothetical protein